MKALPAFLAGAVAVLLLGHLLNRPLDIQLAIIASLGLVLVLFTRLEMLRRPDDH